MQSSPVNIPGPSHFPAPHHDTLGTWKPKKNEFARDIRDISFPPIVGSLRLDSDRTRRVLQQNEDTHHDRRAGVDPEGSVRHSASTRSYGSVNVSHSFSKVSPSEEATEEIDPLLSEYVTVDTQPEATPPMVSYAKLTKLFKRIVSPSIFNRFSQVPHSGFIPDVKDFYDPQSEADYLSGAKIKYDLMEISKVALYHLAQFDQEKFPFSQNYEKVFASAIQMNHRTKREMGVAVQCGLYSLFGACNAAAPLLGLLNVGSATAMALSSAISCSTVFLPALVSWRITGANPHQSSVINNLKQDIEQRLKDDYILYSVTLIRLHHGNENEMHFAREVASKCNIDFIEKLLDDVGVPNANVVVSSLREAVDYVLEATSPPLSVPLQQEIRIIAVEQQMKILMDKLPSSEKDLSRISLLNDDT